MTKIIVWDPRGKYPAGAFSDQPLACEQLQRLGVVLLPVDRSRGGMNPVGDFFFRSWGTGWVWGERQGAHAGCPMLLYVDPDVREVHWRARLAPLENVEPKGFLRLTAMSGALGSSMGGLSAQAEPVDCGKLGEPDEFGGWTVGSMSPISTTTVGYLALQLYGPSVGVRVLWTACSAVK